ncbi:outer membrane receptor domain protein, partial [Acinetobacter baumannii 1426993]
VEKNNKIRAQNLKSILEAVQPNKETAFSYAGTVHWRFAPNYILSLTGTHQERLPNAQESKHPANTALPSGPISLNLVPT